MKHNGVRLVICGVLLALAACAPQPSLVLTLLPATSTARLPVTTLSEAQQHGVEEITFQSGSFKIVGDLRLPEGEGVFLLSALAFNLLLAILFVAQKNGWTRAVRGIGTLWLLLAFPLVFVFARYLAEGRGLGILVPLALVLLYMLVEFLLDFVFKVEFRSSWKTHVPYIVLEYIALFSLIRIAFSIDRTWGYLVSIAFWILLASLIYLFSGKLRTRKRQGSVC
jgi:hypothetical protein